jgi:hypothetical protein
LVVPASVRVCSAIAPGVYGAEVKFGIENIGMVYVYPCPNILAIVCCGAIKVGAEPSMVVQLWKWFTGIRYVLVFLLLYFFRWFFVYSPFLYMYIYESLTIRSIQVLFIT